MSAPTVTQDTGLKGRVTEAAAEIEQRGESAPATIHQLFESMRPQIARALPKGMTAERMIRVALTAIKSTPRLAECDPMSLIGAVMLSAQLGLEPGPLGHVYFVPFRNNKKGGIYEVTFIIGYKGIIDLAQRSGKLLSIESREVYTGDEFEFEYGLDPILKHRPKMDGDRGDLRAVYGVAHYKDGGRFFWVMPKSEIEKHRNRSTSKNDGPWVTDYDAMARKTVIRAMAPFLPLTVEAAVAIVQDETVQHGITEQLTDLATPAPVVDGEVVNTETGEITSADEPQAAPADEDGGAVQWPDAVEPGSGTGQAQS